MKLLYAIASALFCVATPVAASAQPLDLSLMSALCSDDYYEDTVGQCGDISAGEIFIFTKYGVVIAGDTDEDVIVLYLDDVEITPVVSIPPRIEDALATNDKVDAGPADQETNTSKVVTVQPPLEIAGQASDDVATTGSTARRIPAGAEAVDEDRTIE